MQDVKNLRRWMVFKLTPRPNGSVEKQPLSVLGGFAACNDPATWASYEDARKYCVEHSDCSLGFVLGKEVGLAVVDIDKARTSKEQPWPAWVEREVEELDSFTEESVSGLGLHVWVWGQVPANRNNQKCHVEIHDSSKMFCVSQAFAERWDEIKPRDLSSLYGRINNGEIGPTYHKPIIAYAWNDAKYNAVISDNWQLYFTSRSDAIQSALWTLARKHEYDAEAIRKEFESSALCAAWGEKWQRLGDKEIQRAIEEVKKRDPGKVLLDEILAGDPVTFNPWEYALKPLPEHKYSGWFPRGRITIVSGSSGAMKTTFLVQTLVMGRNGEAFLGHQGGRLQFFMVFADRGKWDVEETFDRMNFQGAIPYRCVNGMGLVAALEAISEAAQKYAVLVIDGGDLLVQDNNDGTQVGSLTTTLQRIAEHYGCSVIVTTGAGKMTSKALKEGAERRTITKGSEVWGRTGGSLFTLNSEGDGTEAVRRLVVQHRNAPTERFLLALINGRLAPQVDGIEIGSLETWMQSQTGLVAWDVAFGAVKDKYGLTKADFKRELKKSERVEQTRTADGLFLRWKNSAQAERAARG